MNSGEGEVSEERASGRRGAAGVAALGHAPSTQATGSHPGDSAAPKVRRGTTVLEWVAIALASLGLSIGLIAVLSGFFAGRDQAGVSGSSSGPGLAFTDLGNAHLGRGQARPRYNSDPPTSGAHVPERVLHDAARLNNDQLLGALAAGNVVLLYGSPHPPPGLSSLAREIAGPFTPALAAAGQAVILSTRPGTTGIVGAAWTHLISVSSASNPALRNFVLYWLGKGSSRPSSGPGVG